MTDTADTLVPDTTPRSAVRNLISAVVKLKGAHLSLGAGTKAIVVSVRGEGRYPVELITPGFPIKFWVGLDDFEILEAPRQDWWRLLESSE